MHPRPAAFAALAPATTWRGATVPSYLRPAGQAGATPPDAATARPGAVGGSVGAMVPGTGLPRYAGSGPLMDAAPYYTIAPLGGAVVPIPPGAYTPGAPPGATVFPPSPPGAVYFPPSPPAAGGFTLGAVVLGVLAVGAGLALYHAATTRAAPAA